jgi:hypothetical protein
MWDNLFMDLTRRDFFKKTGQIALAAGLSGYSLSSCLGAREVRKSPEETLRKDNDARLTRDWDPIYGPSIRWASKYGGPANFDGHILGGATPGVDYDVPIGTPLVPMMTSYLRQHTHDSYGSLYILLITILNPAYRISFGHLSEVFPDEQYSLSGDGIRNTSVGVKPSFIAPGLGNFYKKTV